MSKFNIISECPFERGFALVLAMVLSIHVLLMSFGALADWIVKISAG